MGQRRARVGKEGRQEKVQHSGAQPDSLLNTSTPQGGRRLSESSLTSGVALVLKLQGPC